MRAAVKPGHRRQQGYSTNMYVRMYVCMYVCSRGTAHHASPVMLRINEQLRSSATHRLPMNTASTEPQQRNRALIEP